MEDSNILLSNIICRLSAAEQFEFCQNFLRHADIWQNYQGWRSQVCQHSGCSGWHDGSPHRLLNYQSCWDSIFCTEDCCEYDPRKITWFYCILISICNIVRQVSTINSIKKNGDQINILLNHNNSITSQSYQSRRGTGRLVT